jgi:hypothetical protein
MSFWRSVLPLALWVDRLRMRAALTALAVQVPWQAGRDKTLSLARSMYAHLPDGSPVWDGPGQVSPLTRENALTVLADI